MVSVPLLPSIAKLRMVSVGQFHRQAFQHTHMSFKKGPLAINLAESEYQKNNDCPLFTIQNTAI